MSARKSSHSTVRIGAALLVVLSGVMYAAYTSESSSASTPTLIWSEAIVEPQPTVVLAMCSLPNTNVSVEHAAKFIPPMDVDSIEMTVIGDSAYYHPVAMIHRCFHFLGAYLKTNDPTYVARTEKYVDKILSAATVIDSALFLPYPFDYKVHKQASLQLKAPWYSAMAQGEFLSITVRLYELTANSKYLALSHQIFRSLLRTHGTHSPWVSRIDTAGYFWLEEYPLSGPDQTLNGFIAAVYGVYDYWRVTRSDDSRRLYDNCLTTLKHYLPDYRRPDTLSYYCLGHQHVADSGYHRLHVSMCRELFRMSGDSVYIEYARGFNADVPLVPEF